MTLKDRNPELASFIRSRQDGLVAYLVEEWSGCLNVSAQEATPWVDSTLTQLADALDSGSADRLLDPFTAWVGEQARQTADGIGPGDWICLTQSLGRGLWNLVMEEDGEQPRKEGQRIEWLRDLTDLVAMVQVAAIDRLMTVRDTLRRQALDQEQARTARLADEQARLARRVRELSSPVIKVWEEVLVLPLVGAIDAERAARIMEDLLQGIVKQQAEIVIVDVTGVPMVDANVITYLMQTIKAANLLGTRTVLVGISAGMARSVVQLGLDLGEVETLNNLQAGIEFALQALQLQIVPQDLADIECEVN